MAGLPAVRGPAPSSPPPGDSASWPSLGRMMTMSSDVTSIICQPNQLTPGRGSGPFGACMKCPPGRVGFSCLSRRYCLRGMLLIKRAPVEGRCCRTPLLQPPSRRFQFRGGDTPSTLLTNIQNFPTHDPVLIACPSRSCAVTCIVRPFLHANMNE